MKILQLFGLLGIAGSVSAQYFSAGWSPGQTAEKEAQTATSFSPPKADQTASKASGSFFDLTRILSSDSAVSFFSRLGVNITERLTEAAVNAQLWDDRIPLITDDNYGDLIVNETLTAEEEEERVWFLVISVTASRQEGLSKYLDDVFDAAYNTAELEGGLQGVRWGRIDYLNVTALTTKWAIWQAPYLVFITNRGKTLRFLKGSRLRLDPEAMRGFLKSESWKSLEPWSTAYSPGGSREWLMELLALVLTKIYNVTVKIPRWLLFVISGGIGSVIIGLLHRNPAKATAQTPSPVVDVVEPPSSPTPAQNTKRAGTRQRKAGKK